jgi:hypothetical protein
MSDTASFQDHLLSVFCCGHVFRRERRVHLVGRPDLDWQFVCGGVDHSNPDDPYHVSIGALLEFDGTLDDLADLPVGWEAERSDIESPWIRTRCGAKDA